MASFKERFGRWKGRKWHQKAGDIIFWLLLVLLIIPGPRKFIATGVNKVFLNFRSPGEVASGNRVKISQSDYQLGLSDLQGNRVNPDSLKGRLIFMNFWATWCPPCIAEMPEIQSLYDRYGDRVTFLVITNQEPGAVEGFLREHGYDFPVYLSHAQPPEVFATRSIPTTFILSPSGEILVHKTGAANWDSGKVHKLFDKYLDQEVLR